MLLNRGCLVLFVASGPPVIFVARLFAVVTQTCNVGAWTTSPAHCAAVCPTLSQPVNTGTCSKQLFNHTFSDATSDFGQYYVTPTLPAVVVATTWFVSGGRVNINTPGASSVLRQTAPSWANTMAPGQDFSLKMTVAVTSGSSEPRRTAGICSEHPSRFGLDLPWHASNPMLVILPVLRAPGSGAGLRFLGSMWWDGL
jgi:hypothetical protein